MQLPPKYEDFEKIAELLQWEGLVDNESIFMIDKYQYTELMKAVNNESVKEEAEHNEHEQINGITLTPEQRKVSFLRSRNIDTQMDLEAQDFADLKILDETKAIFVNIFKDYWATPEKKKKIIEKQNYDKSIIEKEKVEK